jgi:acyl-coenzyme A synthetase/AMP-(fatty) acid ligase
MGPTGCGETRSSSPICGGGATKPRKRSRFGTNPRAFELERTLVGTGVTVVVTVDRRQGYDNAAALREVASRLPEVRHIAVYFTSGASGEPKGVLRASTLHAGVRMD